MPISCSAACSGARTQARAVGRDVTEQTRVELGLRQSEARHRAIVEDQNEMICRFDPDFRLSPEWYEQVARSRPPKDKPWYHVLVHDSDGVTYVAERNLAPSDVTEPIRHPLLERYFDVFHEGRYQRTGGLN